MVDFSALKNSRGSNLEKLKKQMERPSYDDPDADTFWDIKRDSAGNGFAIIRFLPCPGDEENNFVKTYSHSFQGPGGWYIEKSLTTLGNNVPDPMGEYNKKLWDTGIEENKKIVSNQKRQLKYVSNILVIKDAANPENEGKVFRFKYGAKIFEKLELAVKPKFEDEEPFDPFCYWGGANFRLKVHGVKRDTDYSSSAFDSPSALFDGDEDKLKAVHSKLYSLQALLDPSKFKTYEELQKRMNKVLGIEGSASVASSSQKSSGRSSNYDLGEDNDLDVTTLMAKTASKEAESPKEKAASTPVQDELDIDLGGSVDSDDEDFEFFANLAKS